MTAGLSARERFLSNASNLLQTNKMSSAAPLRHEADVIRSLAGTASQKNSENCCPACGSLNVEERSVISNNKSSKSHVGPKQQKHLQIRKCQGCQRSVKTIVTDSVAEPLCQEQRQPFNVLKSDPESHSNITPVSSKIAKTSSKSERKNAKIEKG